jgi:hypothetical protein
LATSDKTTIVIEKQPDGKMRITSGSWNGEKIFLKDQVIEVRHANALGCIARKTKAPDEWTHRSRHQPLVTTGAAGGGAFPLP